MPIGHSLIESLADMGHPLINVHLTTRQTKAALTAESDALLFETVLTKIGDVAGGRIATTPHLCDNVTHLGLLVARIALLEGLPMIAEDLLEGRFIDPLSVVCHGAWLYHGLTGESISFSDRAVALPMDLLPQSTAAQASKKEILIRSR